MFIPIGRRLCCSALVASLLILVAAADPSHELASVNATQNGGTLEISIDAKQNSKFDTLLIFLRTDPKAEPSYEPTGRTGERFNMLVQGPTLFAYAGSNNSWTWNPIGGVTVKQTDKNYRVEVPLNRITGKQVEVGVWSMTGDWMTVEDIKPEHGFVKVALDGKAIASAATSQPSSPPVAMAEPRANRNQLPRERFRQARSYYCYYGANRVAELSHYDIGILHTPAMTPADVKALKDVGCVPVGYLSVGEDETLRAGDGKGPGGKASWYFDRDKDGQPDRNGDWGSFFANANNPKWRKDRLDEQRKLIEEYGFDGVFLDTIEVPDLYPESKSGMIQLVQELRAAFPDKVIVANRAFNLLKEPQVASAIDGVMYESFTSSYSHASKSYFPFNPGGLDATRRIAEKVLVPVVKTRGMQVLALDYCEPTDRATMQMDFDRAATFGFLVACANIHLDQIYDTRSIVGKPDPKYRTKLSTPENLAYKLDAARNGFAAGTQVIPSSCFMGYTAAPVVDGIRDRAKLDWMVSNWASEEEPQASQDLTFVPPKPFTGGTLKVTFAFDNKQWFPSRNFKVDIKRAGSNNAAWETVDGRADNRENVVSVKLPDVPIQAVRVVQQPGGGSEARPDLMWVGQVELLGAK